MFHYLRRMFASRPINPRQLQRTVSGLDRHHIESGNYLYKNFIKNKKKRDIVRILGGISSNPWPQVKKPHPNRKPSHLYVRSKGNNPPPSSRKN